MDIKEENRKKAIAIIKKYEPNHRVLRRPQSARLSQLIALANLHEKKETLSKKSTQKFKKTGAKSSQTAEVKKETSQKKTASQKRSPKKSGKRTQKKSSAS